MIEIGIVAPVYQSGAERRTVRWPEIRDIAVRAEALGFDTIWVPDELVWFLEGELPVGVWEGVSVMGAIAATTSRAKVGSWVMSALHRNPGIIAKAAETLDEISGGRFVFGLGAGHAWPGQAHAFGLPEDKTFDRFEEALQVIVPLLRQGQANFDGAYHAARELRQVPQGPRPGRIPLMIGGNGPKGQRAAVRYADVWSGWTDKHVDEAYERIPALEAICAEEGRDPKSIGRSIGVGVRPLPNAEPRDDILTGTSDEIAAKIRSYGEAGYTQVELQSGPATVQALEALAPVLELVRS
jgi:alkanesulfonate monooxygenase SsuD/methylene tetrahydromethanopterin reductase-like flavin-dependent oxidoreductase (luciferase family)